MELPLNRYKHQIEACQSVNGTVRYFTKEAPRQVARIMREFSAEYKKKNGKLDKDLGAHMMDEKIAEARFLEEELPFFYLFPHYTGNTSKISSYGAAAYKSKKIKKFIDQKTNLSDQEKNEAYQKIVKFIYTGSLNRLKKEKRDTEKNVQKLKEFEKEIEKTRESDPNYKFKKLEMEIRTCGTKNYLNNTNETMNTLKDWFKEINAPKRKDLSDRLSLFFGALTLIGLLVIGGKMMTGNFILMENGTMTKNFIPLIAIIFLFLVFVGMQIKKYSKGI